MVFAQDIRETIIRMANECGHTRPFRSSDVARHVDPENWKSTLEQVRLVADSLVQEGILIALQSDDQYVPFQDKTYLKKPSK